jgi:hypothetical protein
MRAAWRLLIAQAWHARWRQVIQKTELPALIASALGADLTPFI